jgi:UDP-N-acetyl-D-glucosamine 2-epimerase, UDP-hydrolysing
MKKIVVLTATRAEYGLLKPVIKKLNADAAFDMRLAVTGMHLTPEFGMTVHEIEADQIPIDKKIEIILSSDTPIAVSKSMGLALISFSEYFEECMPDALVVLGDRYETLAVCCAAMNARIPIFHLHGGEATEGLIDEAIRHAITKMSYLHFASTEDYRRRIIQMGESPKRVFNVGALGVENALHANLLSLREVEESLEYVLGGQYAVGTFHPVTLEKATAKEQVEELLLALDEYPDINYVFTKANSDMEGRYINRLLQDYAENHDNFLLVGSLGMRRYLSVLKYATFVIGNSSSGLIEAPSFGIPTINIGDRQKGRIAGSSVLQCLPDKNSICKAMQMALSNDFRKRARNAANPYGDGRTSDRVMEIIRNVLVRDGIEIKKKFYDINAEELYI